MKGREEIKFRIADDTMWNKTMNYTSNNGSHLGNTDALKLPSSRYYMMSLQVVIVLMVTILIVDLIGNSIVVLVIVLQRRMQTFTNWLIFNLAVADLSVAIICIPLELPLELNKVWIYGKSFCKILFPMESATIYASVFTLVVLSTSRYWAIIHPYKTQPTTHTAKLSICIVWISSFLLVIPYMLGLQYNEKERACAEVWNDTHRRAYTLTTFTMQYVLPLTIIIVAYAYIIYEITLKNNPSASLYEDKKRNEEGRKLVKLLLIITIMFALCVLPYHVIALLYEFGQVSDISYMEDLSVGSYLLLYLNSALNPVIYNIFSSSFREAFWGWYKRFSKRVWRRGNNSVHSYHGDRYVSNQSVTRVIYSRGSVHLPASTNRNQRRDSLARCFKDIPEDELDIDDDQRGM